MACIAAHRQCGGRGAWGRLPVGEDEYFSLCARSANVRAHEAMAFATDNGWTACFRPPRARHSNRSTARSGLVVRAATARGKIDDSEYVCPWGVHAPWRLAGSRYPRLLRNCPGLGAMRSVQRITSGDAPPSGDASQTGTVTQIHDMWHETGTGTLPLMLFLPVLFCISLCLH